MSTQTDLLDDDGENKALRCFLLVYGGANSVTIGRMRANLNSAGWNGFWPEWAGIAHKDQHLTKGGAQSWIRHLISLEATATPTTDASTWIEQVKLYVGRLDHWRHCMSYNDSYFGEPGGLVKRITRELSFLMDKAPAADERPARPSGEWTGDPDSFQTRVQPWMMECFGPVIAADQQERSHRFIEEALELIQACGATRSEAHQLVDYVFNRPVGDKPQEVGGVMVTLAALCLAHKMDMHKAGEIELARIWTKVEQIRAKQASKPKHSPLPGPCEERRG